MASALAAIQALLPNSLQPHPKPVFLFGKPKKWNLKCGSTKAAGPEGDNLSNIVEQRVEELLGREENKGLLDKLNQASQRVELAKQQLAHIQTQQLEAQRMRVYMDDLQNKASQIAECERQVLEAKAMVEGAERCLPGGINKLDEEERWESVKSGSISGLVGTVAALPIYLANANPITTPQLLLQLGTTFVSCALFGITFRYAVRRDLDNLQLKIGTSAAFALVKGLATLNGGPPLQLNSHSFYWHALDAGIFVSQDLLIFAFVAVALDFCFKTRTLTPFPINVKDE